MDLIRVGPNSSFGFQRFAREILVLSQLQHPNVVELAGFHFVPQEFRAWIVCPWMPNGDADKFVRNHQAGDFVKLTLVRLSCIP